MGLYNAEAFNGDEDDNLPVMDVVEIDSKIDDFFMLNPPNAKELLADKALSDEYFKDLLFDLANIDDSKDPLTANAYFLGAAQRMHKHCENLVREMVENGEF